MRLSVLLHPLLALLLAPLLGGVVNRVKALFAGRRGPSLLQPYRDLRKLLGKGAVYSVTTSWVFKVGSSAGLAALIAASLLVPFGGVPGALAFPGDLVLLAYLLAVTRFFTVLSALDTGSSFEGMGASREAAFSALTEPVFFLALATLVRLAGTFSLSEIPQVLAAGAWARSGPVLALVAASLFIIFLAENSRLPFDDPNTHLELTMIHEAMILDHGGPDLAMVLYSSWLKMWLLGAVLTGVLLPLRGPGVLVNTAAALAGMFLLAALTGVVESSMARLRLVRVPSLILGAGVLSSLALLLVLR